MSRKHHRGPGPSVIPQLGGFALTGQQFSNSALSLRVCSLGFTFLCLAQGCLERGEPLLELLRPLAHLGVLSLEPPGLASRMACVRVGLFGATSRGRLDSNKTRELSQRRVDRIPPLARESKTLISSWAWALALCPSASSRLAAPIAGS